MSDVVRVVFLHGLESSPTGPKVQRLRQRADFEVFAPLLPTQPIIDFLKQAKPDAVPSELIEPSVLVGAEAVRRHAPHVVVGSSFGGMIAALLAQREVWAGPLVLLAPATRVTFSLPARHGRAVILHGRQDETVPVEGSVQLAARSAAEVTLWLVDDDHRLTVSQREGRIERAIGWAVSP